MPAKAITRLFICKTHIGNHIYSFCIILIWTIQNVVYYRTHNCLSSASLDVFFFFGNLSQHFRTNQKAELVWGFLTDAPTEVDFPVLLPMVHDGTCCDLRQGFDGDQCEFYVKFDYNNLDKKTSLCLGNSWSQRGICSSMCVVTWKELKVTTRTGREALVVFWVHAADWSCGRSLRRHH